MSYLKECKKCNISFESSDKRRKFCGLKCYHLFESESRKGKGNPRYGISPSLETREKMSNIMKTIDTGTRFKSGPKELHPKYIKDRTKLKKQNERNDSAYFEWRKQVWSRDNWKCKILNKDCTGRIEAHHILGWTDYPELRYKINNGITLCHAHHPRKRAEEKRLSPYFMELVSVSK